MNNILLLIILVCSYSTCILLNFVFLSKSIRLEFKQIDERQKLFLKAHQDNITALNELSRIISGWSTDYTNARNHDSNSIESLNIKMNKSLELMYRAIGPERVVTWPDDEIKK